MRLLQDLGTFWLLALLTAPSVLANDPAMDKEQEQLRSEADRINHAYFFKNLSYAERAEQITSLSAQTSTNIEELLDRSATRAFARFGLHLLYKRSRLKRLSVDDRRRYAELFGNADDLNLEMNKALAALLVLMDHGIHLEEDGWHFEWNARIRSSDIIIGSDYHKALLRLFPQQWVDGLTALVREEASFVDNFVILPQAMGERTTYPRDEWLTLVNQYLQSFDYNLALYDAYGKRYESRMLYMMPDAAAATFYELRRAQHWGSNALGELKQLGVQVTILDELSQRQLASTNLVVQTQRATEAAIKEDQLWMCAAAGATLVAACAAPAIVIPALTVILEYGVLAVAVITVTNTVTAALLDPSTAGDTFQATLYATSSGLIKSTPLFIWPPLLAYTGTRTVTGSVAAATEAQQATQMGLLIYGGGQVAGDIFNKGRDAAFDYIQAMSSDDPNVRRAYLEQGVRNTVEGGTQAFLAFAIGRNIYKNAPALQSPKATPNPSSPTAGAARPGLSDAELAASWTKHIEPLSPTPMVTEPISGWGSGGGGSAVATLPRAPAAPPRASASAPAQVTSINLQAIQAAANQSSAGAQALQLSSPQLLNQPLLGAKEDPAATPQPRIVPFPGLTERETREYHALPNLVRQLLSPLTWKMLNMQKTYEAAVAALRARNRGLIERGDQSRQAQLPIDSSGNFTLEQNEKNPNSAMLDYTIDAEGERRIIKGDVSINIKPDSAATADFLKPLDQQPLLSSHGLHVARLQVLAHLDGEGHINMSGGTLVLQAPNAADLLVNHPGGFVGAFAESVLFVRSHLKPEEFGDTEAARLAKEREINALFNTAMAQYLRIEGITLDRLLYLRDRSARFIFRIQINSGNISRPVTLTYLGGGIEGVLDLAEMLPGAPQGITTDMGGLLTMFEPMNRDLMTAVDRIMSDFQNGDSFEGLQTETGNVMARIRAHIEEQVAENLGRSINVEHPPVEVPRLPVQEVLLTAEEFNAVNRLLERAHRDFESDEFRAVIADIDALPRREFVTMDPTTGARTQRRLTSAEWEYLFQTTPAGQVLHARGLTSLDHLRAVAASHLQTDHGIQREPDTQPEGAGGPFAE